MRSVDYNAEICPVSGGRKKTLESWNGKIIQKLSPSSRRNSVPLLKEEPLYILSSDGSLEDSCNDFLGLD